MAIAFSANTLSRTTSRTFFYSPHNLLNAKLLFTLVVTFYFFLRIFFDFFLFLCVGLFFFLRFSLLGDGFSLVCMCVDNFLYIVINFAVSFCSYGFFVYGFSIFLVLRFFRLFCGFFKFFKFFFVFFFYRRVIFHEWRWVV